MTGYDNADRPLGSVVTIPSAAGALAGSYSTGYVYFPDGQLTAIIDPAQGGLPAETTDTGRTALGRPSSMGSLTVYVTGVDYRALGQVTNFDRNSRYAAANPADADCRSFIKIRGGTG